MVKCKLFFVSYKFYLSINRISFDFCTYFSEFGIDISAKAVSCSTRVIRHVTMTKISCLLQSKPHLSPSDWVRIQPFKPVLNVSTDILTLKSCSFRPQTHFLWVMYYCRNKNYIFFQTELTNVFFLMEM